MKTGVSRYVPEPVDLRPTPGTAHPPAALGVCGGLFQCLALHAASNASSKRSTLLPARPTNSRTVLPHNPLLSRLDAGTGSDLAHHASPSIWATCVRLAHRIPAPCACICTVLTVCRVGALPQRSSTSGSCVSKSTVFQDPYPAYNKPQQQQSSFQHHSISRRACSSSLAPVCQQSKGYHHAALPTTVPPCTAVGSRQHGGAPWLSGETWSPWQALWGPGQDWQHCQQSGDCAAG